MKTILVERNKCPLDVIAEMGEQVKNAWLFLDEKCVNYLHGNANDTHTERNHPHTVHLTWNETEEQTETKVILTPFSSKYYSVDCIYADDISFTVKPSVPDDVYLFEFKNE